MLWNEEYSLIELSSAVSAIQGPILLRGKSRRIGLTFFVVQSIVPFTRSSVSAALVLDMIQ